MGLRLKAELDGDGGGFDRMMNKANAAKDKFAAGFAGLKNIIAGAFSIGAIANLSKQTLALAGHLRDISDALAVNVEWFQKRANAAKLAGASEDDLSKFLDTMNKSREEAFNKPDGEMAQRFSRLGFSQSDIASLNTMDFFDQLIKAFANGGSQQATVDVEAVGGRAARNLLASFYNQFAGDVPYMTEDVVNQLDDIGDRFSLIGIKIKVGLAPALAKLGTVIDDMLLIMGRNAGFWGSFFGNLSATGDIKEAYGAGRSGQSSVAEAQAKENADLLKALQEARANRRRRESSPPNFSPLPPLPDLLDAAKDGPEGTNNQGKRGPQLATDSLVGIGNFLGRNPSLVNTVANQELVESRKQSVLLQQILTTLKAPRGAALNDLTVPTA